MEAEGRRERKIKKMIKSSETNLSGNFMVVGGSSGSFYPTDIY